MILHFLPTLVGFLYDSQLGVGIADWEVGVGGVLGAVKEQSPLADVSRLHGSVDEGDLQRPLAPRVLGPGVGGHEGPLGEPVRGIVVIGSLRQNH